MPAIGVEDASAGVRVLEREVQRQKVHAAHVLICQVQWYGVEQRRVLAAMTQQRKPDLPAIGQMRTAIACATALGSLRRAGAQQHQRQIAVSEQTARQISGQFLCLAQIDFKRCCGIAQPQLCIGVQRDGVEEVEPVPAVYGKAQRARQMQCAQIVDQHALQPLFA